MPTVNVSICWHQHGTDSGRRHQRWAAQVGRRRCSLGTDPLKLLAGGHAPCGLLQIGPNRIRQRFSSAVRQGYEFHGIFNGFRVCATPVHAGATPFSAIVGWGHPHVVAWPVGLVSVRPRPSYCLAGGRMAGGSWWGSFLRAPRLSPRCLNCFEGEDYGGALIHRHHQDNDQHRTVVRSNQPSRSAP